MKTSGAGILANAGPPLDTLRERTWETWEQERNPRLYSS
jgi:hypothetical protein